MQGILIVYENAVFVRPVIVQYVLIFNACTVCNFCVCHLCFVLNNLLFHVFCLLNIEFAVIS